LELAKQYLAHLRVQVQRSDFLKACFPNKLLMQMELQVKMETVKRSLTQKLLVQAIVKALGQHLVMQNFLARDCRLKHLQ
jgi:hypothetical protein